MPEMFSTYNDCTGCVIVKRFDTKVLSEFLVFAFLPEIKKYWFIQILTVRLRCGVHALFCDRIWDVLSVLWFEVSAFFSFYRSITSWFPLWLSPVTGCKVYKCRLMHLCGVQQGPIFEPTVIEITLFSK